MIYVVERNGNKEKIVLPDNARLATAEDMAYFQAQADEATARRNRQIEINNIVEEIGKRNVKISNLKTLLNKNDYKRGKYIDGFLTKEEYEPTRLQMQEWRVEINLLEEEIAILQERLNTI